MSSPCIRLCLIDPHSALCRGCGRTLDEIAGWGTMPEPARRALVSRLPARMSAAVRRAADRTPP